MFWDQIGVLFMNFIVQDQTVDSQTLWNTEQTEGSCLHKCIILLQNNNHPTHSQSDKSMVSSDMVRMFYYIYHIRTITCLGLSNNI